MNAYWRAANYICVGQIYCSPMHCCRGVEYLGVHIDAHRNHRTSGGEAPALVSRRSAAVQVWLVPTDDGGEFARELYDVLRL